jgi:hypothetical protein
VRQSVFIVDEMNIGSFVWDALKGRRPFYFKVAPLFLWMRGPLERLISALERRGRVAHVRELSERLPWIEGIPGRGWYNDLFQTIERRLHSHFGTDRAAPGADPVQYLSRKVLNYYANRQIETLLLCEWLDANQDRDDWELVGAHANFGLLHEWYFDRPVPYRWRRSRPAARLINTMNLISAIAYPLFWLAAKSRPWPIRKEQVRLIADGYPPYEHLTIGEVIDDPEDVIVFHRADDKASRGHERYSSYRESVMGDARIEVWKLPRFFLDTVSELVQLWRDWRDKDPSLVAQMLSNVARAVQDRTYFNRFRPKFFFSRDDYRTDHILRTRELRRIGATALGITHGLPRNTVFYGWREIDFDIYYVFGSYLCEHAYKEFWPEHMRVTPVGCYRIDRSRLAAARARNERSGDIAYFPMVTHGDERLLNEVFEIARQAPTRTVFIKPKRGRAAREMAAFQQKLKSAPKNVTVCDDDPYELLAKVGYCLTSGSTVTVEALQHRCVTFVFDIEPEITQLYYRNFPGLCVVSGKDVVARIEAVERGAAVYRFEDYCELVKLDGDVVYDIIRRDIGLEAKAA